MRAINIPRVKNDCKYLNDLTREGMTIDEKTFFHFIRGMIEDYGVYRKNSVSLNFNDIPWQVQLQYLKQYLFFEGYIEFYEELINGNGTKLNVALEEEREGLVYWLNHVLRHECLKLLHDYLEDNHLKISHHKDGDPFITKRYY